MTLGPPTHPRVQLDHGWDSARTLLRTEWKLRRFLSVCLISADQRNDRPNRVCKVLHDDHQ
jgi:hypothetical protein